MLRSSDGFYDFSLWLSASFHICWPSSHLFFLCKDLPSAIEHANHFLLISNTAADGTLPCSNLLLQHRCQPLLIVFQDFLVPFGACSQRDKMIHWSHLWWVKCWPSCWYSECSMDPSLIFFSKVSLKPGILLACQNKWQSFLGSRGYHHWQFYLLFRIFPMPCCTTFCQSRPMQAISISQCYLRGLRCLQRI